MASTTPGGGIALTGETHDDTFIAAGLVRAVGSSRGGSDDRLVPHLWAAEPGESEAMCRVRHHVRDRARYGESRRDPRGFARACEGTSGGRQRYVAGGRVARRRRDVRGTTLRFPARRGAAFPRRRGGRGGRSRSEEHTSELQSRSDLVCRLLLEKKK